MTTRIYASSPEHWNWRIPISHRQGSRCGRMLLVGGQCDLDRTGNIKNPGRMAAQVDTAMDNVEKTIAALDGRMEDVVKIGVFFAVGSSDAEEELMRQIRGRVRGTVPPAISLVALPRLAYPGLLAFIDAIAIDNTDAGAPRRAAMPGGIWPWPRGAEFSHGLRCGEYVFLSAQTARDASGTIRFPQDIVSQARMTIENIARVLEAAGADLDDVVKLNTWYLGYGTDADWRRAADIRSNAFRFPGPGATGVPVPSAFPDGGLIRQECWAMRGVGGERLPRSLSWPLDHWDWPMRVSFQQGLKIGKTIIVGGQVALDSKGRTVHANDMVAQTRAVMDFIKAILAGFDTSLDSLVKVSCFYNATGDAEAALHTCFPMQSRYFGEVGPPVTMIPLDNLGFEGVMLEIEGVAILD